MWCPRSMRHCRFDCCVWLLLLFVSNGVWSSAERDLYYEWKHKRHCKMVTGLPLFGKVCRGILVYACISDMILRVGKDNGWYFAHSLVINDYAYWEEGTRFFLVIFHPPLQFHQQHRLHFPNDSAAISSMHHAHWFNPAKWFPTEERTWTQTGQIRIWTSTSNRWTSFWFSIHQCLRFGPDQIKWMKIIINVIKHTPFVATFRQFAKTSKCW